MRRSLYAGLVHIMLSLFCFRINRQTSLGRILPNHPIQYMLQFPSSEETVKNYFFHNMAKHTEVAGHISGCLGLPNQPAAFPDYLKQLPHHPEVPPSHYGAKPSLHLYENADAKKA